MLPQAHSLCQSIAFLQNACGDRIWTEDNASRRLMNYMDSRTTLRETDKYFAFY